MGHAPEPTTVLHLRGSRIISTSTLKEATSASMASCIKRCTSYKEHCSTYYWWEKAIKVSGIFNAYRNPKMAGWHHTFAGYCSSDAWMGKAQLNNFDPWSGPKKDATAFL